MTEHEKSKLPQRKSIRLKGYDYSREGFYFITVCIQNHFCLFGKIDNDKMILNDAGKMVEHHWMELAERFSNIELYESVVMPNHFHGIIEIVDVPGVGGQNAGLQSHVGRPQGIAPTDVPNPDQADIKSPIGAVVGAFKSLTTVDYIRNVKQSNWKPFNKKLWQRNYHEHIIKNEESFGKIRNYIQTNPIQWQNDKYYM